MKPPPTIMAGILDSRWFRHPLRRRLSFLFVALILAVFCVWPRHYLAKAEMMPQDTGGGLSALLAQTGGMVNLGALLGNHQSIEADLTIARSQAVLRDVVTRLHLIGHSGYPSFQKAEVKLRRKIDVSAIRGSILQIRAQDVDPAFAQRFVAAYTVAIQDRLTALNLEQAAQKRTVANNRMAEATARLAAAQAAITRYQTANRLAAPEIQLGAAVGGLASLQGQLQAKQVALQTAQQFATQNNIQVKAMQNDIAGLQRQIAEAETAAAGAGGPTLANIALRSSEYFNLYRDEKFAETLFIVYSKYMEQVTIDELSANANMNVIEPPFIDPARQYNAAPIGLLILLILIAAAAEFYIAAPPVGRR
jgi:tyrosine-protein kinase Etk/Wzc